MTMTKTRITSAFLFLVVVAAPGFSQTVPPPSAPTPPSVPSIAVTPYAGQQPKAGQAIPISGSEFEMFQLNGYTGKVRWDVDVPTGSAVPIKLFLPKPNSSVIGIRVGQTEPASYDVPAGSAVVVYAVGQGQASLTAWGVDGEGFPQKLSKLLIDANKAPQPPPTPTPKPPTPAPTPAPDANPVPSDKLRVLILYDDNKKLTPIQTGVLNASTVLSSITAAGGTWYRWDKTVDPTNATLDQWWKDAWKRPHPELPWYVISSPKGFSEGKLPATVEEWQATVDKYK